MSAPTRTTLVELGPRNGSCWSLPMSSALVTPTATAQVVFGIPPITVNTVQGNPIQDALPSDNVMFNISQYLIVATTHHAASEVGNALSLSLYRAGVQVGGGPFAGWTSGANPDLPALQEVAIPFITTNTAALRALNINTPISAAHAVVACHPGDVIVVTGNIPTDANCWLFADGH